MQPKIKQNKCIALQEANNEPVCGTCLQKEMEDWLVRRRPRLLASLKKVASQFFKDDKFSNNIICIKCNKQLNICDYCYKKHIRKWIETKYPKLLLEFRLFF